jgi:hypothetical protein
MKNILVIVGLFFSTFLVAEEVLYCVPELNTGFVYENNSFIETTFELKRFSVKVIGDIESIQIGKWNYSCNKSNLDSLYFCRDTSDIGKYFNLNKENGRYTSVTATGYGYLRHSSSLLGTAPDTDSIEAGKCEKF